MARRPCLEEHCKNCDRAEAKERSAREAHCVDENHRLTLVTKRVRRHSPVEDRDIGDLVDVDFIKKLGPQDIVKAQEKDPDLGNVLEWVKRGNERPQWSEVSTLSEVTKNCWAQWGSLCQRNNILYRKWEPSDGTTTRLRLMLPKSLQEEVLTHHHNHPTGGHFGIKKTLERLNEKFYWPRCREDVKLWCSTCGHGLFFEVTGGICSAKPGSKNCGYSYIE